MEGIEGDGQLSGTFSMFFVSPKLKLNSRVKPETDAIGVGQGKTGLSFLLPRGSRGEPVMRSAVLLAPTRSQASVFWRSRKVNRL